MTAGSKEPPKRHTPAYIEARERILIDSAVSSTKGPLHWHRFGIEASAWRTIEGIGLFNPEAAEVLQLALAMSCRGQPLTRKYLLSKLRASPNTIDRIVASLVRAEFLRKVESANDKRAVELYPGPQLESTELARDHGFVETIVRQAGLASEDDDVVRRRLIHIERIPAEDHHFRCLIDACRAISISLNLPFGRQELMRLSELVDLRYAHVCDVAPNDPGEYRFVVLGNFGWRPDLGRPDRPTGIVHPELRKFVVSGCVAAKHSAEPIYDQISSRTSNGEMSYSRLIVPFSDRRSRVNRLLIAVHERPIPDLFKDLPSAIGQFGS